MDAVFFYHMTAEPLEAVLPPLLEKARSRGWRVEIRGRDAARLDALDEALWRVPTDGFLPHGRAGGPHDAAQPVLLCREGEAARNGAACLMAVDGAEVSAAEAAALERACILFHEADDGAVERARAQWRALTGAGLAAQYWAQEDGRWVKKSERGGQE